MSALALAVWVCAAAAPQPFFWPKPDVVEEIDVPDAVQADGVPVRLHVMRSKLGVQALLERFGNAFVHAGFYVAQTQQRHIAEPHVTGLDWKGLVSYSAILSPNPDGTTTCLLGEAALKSKKRDAPDFAPLFPSARDVVRVNQEGSRVLSYAVQGATTAEVRQFYVEALSSAGYRSSPDRSDAWEKGDEHIAVLPQAASGGAVTVVLVQRRE